jgi:glutaredoxin
MEAAWLDEKKVKYELIHVDKDQKEAEDMVKKTGQMGVPVTAIQFEGGEEEFVVGFDRPQLSQILNV